MADFCHDCTADTFSPDVADRNDLRHDHPAGLWALCEGCGIHRFTPDGRRLCTTGPLTEETAFATVIAGGCKPCEDATQTP